MAPTTAPSPMPGTCNASSSPPTPPEAVFQIELVQTQRRCGHGANHWLDLYPSTAEECHQLVLSQPDCSHEFFDYAEDGDRNCGCVAPGTDCATNGAGWKLRPSRIYRAVMGAAATTLPTGFSDSTRISSSEGYPCFTQMAALPDGRLFLLGKTGVIYIANPDSNVGQRLELAQYLVLEGVSDDDETGALSLVIDPGEWSMNGPKLVYVYWTRHADAAAGRTGGGYISSFVHIEGPGGTESRAEFSSETVLWRDTDGLLATANRWHYGGQLSIGPDNRIYLALGDKTVPELASSRSHYAGCVVRIEKNGSFPETGNLPADVKPAGCWAYGLRNGWGATWVNVLGSPEYVVGNVGSNSWQGSVNYEEINLVRDGDHLGWPDCEGFCRGASYEWRGCNCSAHTDPLLAYEHRDPQFLSESEGPTGWRQYGAAVIGGLGYNGSRFPADFVGSYFYGDFIRGWIRRIKFRETGGEVRVAENLMFHRSAHDIMSFTTDVSGVLWYASCVASRNGQLNMIDYHSPVHHRISAAEANTTTGTAPLIVVFTASLKLGTILEESNGCNISLRWDFGDGTSSYADSFGRAVHTYRQNGVFFAHAISLAPNGHSTVSASIQVMVGTPPQISISSPHASSQVDFGSTVQLSAVATDANGIDNDICWTVDFIHNEHLHPLVSGNCGPNLSFMVRNDQHGYGELTGLRFSATAIDNNGLSTVVHVEKWISRPQCILHPWATPVGDSFRVVRRRTIRACTFECSIRSSCSACSFTAEGICRLFRGSPSLVADSTTQAGVCQTTPIYIRQSMESESSIGNNIVGMPTMWGEFHQRMPSALGEVAAGLVNDILVVVGEGNSGTMVLNVSNAQYTEWTVGAVRPYVGHHHLALTIGNELFIIGGFDNGSPRTVQVYDPLSDTWRIDQPYPGLGKGSYSGAVIGGNAYVCGGLYYDVTNRAGRQSAYNFVAGDCFRRISDAPEPSWLAVPNMLQAVHHTASGTDGRHLYVFGGRTVNRNIAGDGIDTLQIYDPSTQQWTFGPAMPFPRSGMGSSPYYNARFWIMGGETGQNDFTHANDDGTFHHVLTYIVATGSYELAVPLPIAAHGIWPVVDYRRNRIFVAGGGDSAGRSETDQLQILGFENDEVWNSGGISSLPIPNSGYSLLPTIVGRQYPNIAPVTSEPQGAVIGNFLYQFGGFGNNFRHGVNFTVVCDLGQPHDRCSFGTPVPTRFRNGALTHAANIVDGTIIYVVGALVKVGYGALWNQYTSNETFAYNTTSDSWVILPDLPRPRGGGGGGVVNGYLHYFGGASMSCGALAGNGPAERLSSVFTADCAHHWALDLSSPEQGWVSKRPLPTPRNHFGSCVYGERIFAIGGQLLENEGCDNQADVQVYDPSLDSWDQVRNLPHGIGHISPATFSTNLGVAVVGGVRNKQVGQGANDCRPPGTEVAGLHHYIASNDSWQFIPMDTGFGASCTAGVVNNTLFVLNSQDLFAYPFAH